MQTTHIKQVDLSRYQNKWYKDQMKAGVLRKVSWYLINHIIFSSPFFPINGIKTSFLRLYGARVGQGVVIKPKVNIKYPWNLVIGDYSWIGEEVWIDNLTCVDIGRNVCISQGAMLLTGNHDYTSTTFDLFVKGISLGDGCWVGAKSLVCPGVICGPHSVLSVMSVAATNLDPYKIYRGNPATEVKERVIKD